MSEQMQALSKPVHWWMRWLNIVFLPGLFFVQNYEGARWALIIYFISFPVGFAAFYWTRDLRMMGLPHIIFWVPLCVYLVIGSVGDASFTFFSAYGLWIALICLTMLISIILDFRAIYQYFTGDGEGE